MEWLYGRQVARLALTCGARRQVHRIAVTPAAWRDLSSTLAGATVPVDECDGRELAQRCGSGDHQGVIVLVDRYPYAAVDEATAGGLVVALDQVTDPRNLGAVARSVLAVGAGGIVIPKDRSAAVTPAAVKASAGATEHLPIAQVTNLSVFLKQAKRDGFWVYGASGQASRSYLDLDYDGRVVLVFGAEGSGLRRLVAQACDELAALPVAPPLDSLNVSVAAAVFLYEVRRRRSVEP